jgi:hypothetical protein
MREMAYGWSIEMLAKAARAGLRIVEVPVDYHRRSGGASKVAGTLRGTVAASAHILRTLWRYRRWRAAPVVAQQLATHDTPAGTARESTATSSQRDVVLTAAGETTRARDALFIVARLPLPGTTKTRLGRVLGHDAATGLYRAFLRDLGARFNADAVRGHYDLFWYYAAPVAYGDTDFAACVPPGARLLCQPEGDFATRLWHGFETLHRRGYARVVVLGSDSPHVPAARVRAAFAALDTHDAVIGPAEDGGYYLLGQRGRPADLFTGIPMSTAAVSGETRARAQALALRMACLTPTFDVDELADLALLRAALDAAPSAEADPAPETRSALRALSVASVPLSLAAEDGVVHGTV